MGSFASKSPSNTLYNLAARCGGSWALWGPEKFELKGQEALAQRQEPGATVFLPPTASRADG